MLLCRQPAVASHSATDVLWPALPTSSSAESMASPPSPSPEGRGEGGGDMFRALLSTSEDVFAVISTENGFLYLSPAVHQLLGFEPQELLG